MPGTAERKKVRITYINTVGKSSICLKKQTVLVSLDLCCGPANSLKTFQVKEVEKIRLGLRALTCSCCKWLVLIKCPGFTLVIRLSEQYWLDGLLKIFKGFTSLEIFILEVK